MAVTAPTAAPPRWHPRGLNNRIIFGLTYHGCSKLPRAMTYGMSDVGTWIAYRLMRTGTDALVHNAAVIRPDASSAELRALAHRTYRSYGRDTVDFIRSLSMPASALEAMVGRLDAAAFETALARGRGAIAVLAHFGNWELGGVLLRRLTNWPLSVVVMKELDPDVDRLRREFRQSLDIDTIAVRQNTETALRLRAELERNRIVAMLADRHLGKDRMAVQLFGRRVFFLRTPALLAYFTGAPIVPTFVYRQDDGRFAVDTGPIIDVPRTGDRDTNIQAAMQMVATTLERYLRTYPHYWYQFYPFWDSQTPESPA